MKKLFAFLTLFLFIAAFAAPTFAECGQPDQCSMKSHGSKSDCGKGSEGCPINGKLIKIAETVLSSKNDIGLSDEQIATVKSIKADAEKVEIRQKAEMQIFMIDMMAKLHEDKVDVEGLNAMIDKGSAGMAEGGKASVAAYAKLKSTLTAEQTSKLKELCKKK